MRTMTTRSLITICIRNIEYAMVSYPPIVEDSIDDSNTGVKGLLWRIAENCMELWRVTATVLTAGKKRCALASCILL